MGLGQSRRGRRGGPGAEPLGQAGWACLGPSVHHLVPSREALPAHPCSLGHLGLGRAGLPPNLLQRGPHGTSGPEVQPRAGRGPTPRPSERKAGPPWVGFDGRDSRAFGGHLVTPRAYLWRSQLKTGGWAGRKEAEPRTLARCGAGGLAGAHSTFGSQGSPAVVCRAGAPRRGRDPRCGRWTLGQGHGCARQPAPPLWPGALPGAGTQDPPPPGALPTPAWAHLREGAGTPTPGSLVSPMLIFYLSESGTGSGFKVSLK